MAVKGLKFPAERRVGVDSPGTQRSGVEVYGECSNESTRVRQMLSDGKDGESIASKVCETS
jgi:hypothetical protein